MKNIKPPGSKEINEHIAIFKKQFDLLKQFKIPKIETWVVDWKVINKISATRTWETQEPFDTLFKKKNLPAVYYFTNVNACDQKLHEAFLQCKKELSAIRIKEGVEHPNYFNLSHVPKQYKDTNCIYAGSVKKDLFGRLIGI